MRRFDMAFDQLPHVVAFGGGHGLYATLSALRRITDRLTAVVTVADDGGSSGRLRKELNCLPPGDLRMALAALCGDDHSGRSWADLLQSRFGGDGPLAGHAVGNLLIAGLWEKLDDPVDALDMVGEMLNTRGRVLPMSSVPLEIVADVIGQDPEHPDEITSLRGQATVAKTSTDVRRVYLEPAEPPAHPEAIRAVEDADYVVLGPGSWFTSVIPHLLVPELSEALGATNAKRVLTLNLQPAGETRGYTPSQHIELLAEHAPQLRLDYVVADPSFATADRHLEAFSASLGAELWIADVAVRDGSPRHDPLRLASIFAEIMGL